jgi:hypothetical protein
VPELQLPDLHLSEAGVYLFAVMVYPRDHARHGQFVRSVQNTVVRRMLRDAYPRKIAPDVIPLLVSAAAGPSLDDEARQLAHRLMGPGYVRPIAAAVMLAFVLACADAPAEREPATLEQARRVIATAGGTRASTRGLGRSSLIEIWRDFAPAAHLWAAMTLSPSLWNKSPASGAALAEFLAYAEELRRRGEAHRPARSRTPLLNANETWRVPSRFILPSIKVELPKPGKIKAMMKAWLEVQ